MNGLRILLRFPEIYSKVEYVSLSFGFQRKLYKYTKNWYKHRMNFEKKFCYVMVTKTLRFVYLQSLPIQEDVGRHWKIEIGDIA